MSEKYAFWVTLRPKWDPYCRGEAEVCKLDFKTTWSEFQKAGQTATEQDKAKLRILNSKTTWSEFQRPSQTATKRGVAELHILNFKTIWSEFQKPGQIDATGGEAKLHIFDFKITWSAELNIHNLKNTSPPQCRSKAVVCVSTPRMYPRSGYFLVFK